MFRRLFIFLFYCLLSLIVLSVLLIYLLPREKLLCWSEQLIERNFSGIEWRIGAVKYIHPLKVRLYEVVLRSRRYRVELPVETLLLTFEPRFPVEHIGLVGVLLGGAIKAEVRFGAGMVTFDNLELSELHLGDFDKLERAINRSMQGRVSFKGRAEIDRSSSRAVHLSGSLDIADFRTRLRHPLFGESDVYFNLLGADISQNGKRVELLRGRAAGPLISGTFYGEIQGDRPWELSILEIRGNLMVQPGLLEKHLELADQLRVVKNHYPKRSIPYRVDGTLREPRLRLY